MKKRMIIFVLLAVFCIGCTVQKETQIYGTIKSVKELTVNPDDVYGISVEIRIDDHAIKDLGLGSFSGTIVNHFTELDTPEIADFKPEYHLILICRIHRHIFLIKSKWAIDDYSCRYISGSD